MAVRLCDDAPECSWRKVQTSHAADNADDGDDDDDGAAAAETAM